MTTKEVGRGRLGESFPFYAFYCYFFIIGGELYELALLLLATLSIARWQHFSSHFLGNHAGKTAAFSFPFSRIAFQLCTHNVFNVH